MRLNLSDQHDGAMVVEYTIKGRTLTLIAAGSAPINYTRGAPLTKTIPAMPVAGGSSSKSQPWTAANDIAFARMNLAQLEFAINSFHIELGRYPSQEEGLNALVQIPPSAKTERKTYLKGSTIPVDSWGHPYIYVFPGKHNKDKFDLFSCGPDGQSNTPDDITNW